MVALLTQQAVEAQEAVAVLGAAVMAHREKAMQLVSAKQGQTGLAVAEVEVDITPVVMVVMVLLLLLTRLTLLLSPTMKI